MPTTTTITSDVISIINPTKARDEGGLLAGIDKVGNTQEIDGKIIPSGTIIRVEQKLTDRVDNQNYYQ